MDAIEKLRAINSWLDFQHEYFNIRVKSFSDFEKMYDYCKQNNIEFLDDLSEFTEKEVNKIKKDLKNLLGYCLWNLKK